MRAAAGGARRAARRRLSRWIAAQESIPRDVAAGGDRVECPARRAAFRGRDAGGRVREFFVQNETIILFAQGLVFFSLGFAVWLQRRRATRLTLTSSLIWLAAFAFVEALAVWGYVFVPIQEELPRRRASSTACSSCVGWCRSRPSCSSSSSASG